MNTHIFKLPSGVEAEVKEMQGIHQRMLTENANKPMGDKLSAVLCDVLIRVGTKTDLTPEFIHNMLSADKKKCLVEARQFSLDFDEHFSFTYEYKDSATGEKREETLDLDLSAGFESRPYKLLVETEDGVEWQAAEYQEYDDIKREFDFELPKSKKMVRIHLLDGKGEAVGSKMKRVDMSSHTQLLIRNPQYLVEKESGNIIPMKIETRDLDRMSIKDLEAIRTNIKNLEGQVDTEIMFEHPEAETKQGKEKDVVVDLLGEIAFFFPSEAI